MITFECEKPLLSVTATMHTISSIDNIKLTKEVLLSQERLSSNKNSPLYEDTVFNPTHGTEGFKLLEMLSSYFSHDNLKIIHQWSQIHYPKESTNTHNHYPDVCGFVYYVKVPEGAGDLVFTFKEANWKTNITPREGLLVVFPGWCDHYVSKNTGDEIRISIAGNLEFYD